MYSRAEVKLQVVLLTVHALAFLALAGSVSSRRREARDGPSMGPSVQRCSASGSASGRARDRERLLRELPTSTERCSSTSTSHGARAVAALGAIVLAAGLRREPPYAARPELRARSTGPSRPASAALPFGCAPRPPARRTARARRRPGPRAGRRRGGRAVHLRGAARRVPAAGRGRGGRGRDRPDDQRRDRDAALADAPRAHRARPAADERRPVPARARARRSGRTSRTGTAPRGRPPAARMREIVLAVKAILGAWQDGTRLDFRGEHTRHTLMPPTFVPGPLEWGPPPVLLGALGPVMTRTAAEVADGLLVMPFHSHRHVRERTLPAVEEGLARAYRPGAVRGLPAGDRGDGPDARAAGGRHAGRARAAGVLRLHAGVPPGPRRRGLGRPAARAQRAVQARRRRWR